MDIHEYQAKEILQHYGIPIPPFAVIDNAEEAESVAAALGIGEAVLKVQVHAGGRGKAGGVKMAKGRKEIAEAAQALLGMKIVNAQTGARGIIARQLIVSALVNVRKEYYLGAVIDRKRAHALLVATPEGGMDIEEVAANDPGKIMSVPITNEGKVRHYNLLRLANFMRWKGKKADEGMAIAAALAKAFVEKDASLIEINPLVETSAGDLIALDAKFSLDDNALYRQPKIAAYFDPTQLPEAEVQAREYDLAYVALDGNIGCMVNGAGLAMATMDMIQLYGGQPANFLDVGGGATQEKVAAGFKIILADPDVKAILVNIFGGIMNCATLAGGIVEAVKGIKLTVPLVVRMEGTNVEEGKAILKQSGLAIFIAASLTEAAKKVVAEVR